MGLMDKKLDKILELFYEYPSKRFTLRNIEKLTKIPKSTVYTCLKQLKKQSMIDEQNQADDNILFKTRKTNHFIEKITESGILEYIEEQLKPSCIILFGGIRKGESTKESDIDLFVEAPSTKEIDLNKFDKILGHKTDLFIKKDINDLPVIPIIPMVP